VNSNLFERTGAFAIEQMNDNKAGAKIIDRISVFTFEGKE